MRARKGLGLLASCIFATGLVVADVSFAGKNDGNGNGGGKGTINPYELSVNAMQDVDKNTDVYINVNVVKDGYSAPTDAKHIQLKSFDKDGVLRWTQNTMGVELSPNGSNTASSATFQYNDMERHQPVQAQVQVQNDQTGDTEVLKTRCSVVLRPDLKVESVSADESVRVGQVVNITAVINESNGDLGATSKVYLREGETVRDYAENVSLNPLTSASVVFSTKFEQAGEYTLTISAEDVNPGDYDNSNNTKTFTITVVESVESVSYWMSYSWNEYEHFHQWSDWYSSGRNSQSGKSEGLYEGLVLSQSYGSSTASAEVLTFPVEKVTLDIYADGNLTNSITLTDLQATYLYDNGYYRYQYSFTNIADGWYLYLQNYKTGSYAESVAQFSKHADDYVYFSTQHVTYWGTPYTYSSSGTFKFGTFLDAKNSVKTRFIVEDDGKSYGGDASVSLTTYPYDYTWNYSWSGGWTTGYNKRTQNYGYSSGMTTP